MARFGEIVVNISHMNNIDNYHLVLLQAESAINRRASDMIESINKQKADLLDQLHLMQDQKLENLQTTDHYTQEAQHVQVNNHTAHTWPQSFSLSV